LQTSPNREERNRKQKCKESSQLEVFQVNRKQHSQLIREKVKKKKVINRKQHSQFLIGDRLKSPIKTAVMEYIVKNSFCLGPIT
jgi:hypothetical protein